MDQRKIRLVVAAIVAPLLISASLPFVSGCSVTPVKVEKRRTKDGRILEKVTDQYGLVQHREAGHSGPQPLDVQKRLRDDFNEATDYVESASKAAAVEREKLVPATPSGQVQPPAGPTSPMTGPKVDLPTQTYQPHQPSTSPPTPPSPPTYTPPGGGTYHPPH